MRYVMIISFLLSGALHASSYEETKFEQVPCKKKKKKKKGCGCGHLDYRMEQSKR